MQSNSGIHNPNVIDALGYDPKSDEYVIAMFETRQWDGSAERLDELQNKLNAYIAFVDGGEFWRNVPDAVGKPVRFELRCLFAPDRGVERFVRDAGDHLRRHNVRFVIAVSGSHADA